MSINAPALPLPTLPAESILIGFGSFSSVLGGLILVAQVDAMPAAGKDVDWNSGVNAIVIGVVGLIVSQLIQQYLSFHKARLEKRERDEENRNIRNDQLADLRSLCEKRRLDLAADRGELAVWRRRCENGPTDREISAARKYAREHPDEFAQS